MTLWNNFSQKMAGGGRIFEKLRYIRMQFELTEVGRLFFLQPGNGPGKFATQILLGINASD